MSLVYTIAELDVVFGYTRQDGERSGGSWWAKNWQRMVREHGFPAPLPGFGRPRFARGAVDRWVEAGGQARPVSTDGFNLDALNAAR